MAERKGMGRITKETARGKREEEGRRRTLRGREERRMGTEGTTKQSEWWK